MNSHIHFYILIQKKTYDDQICEKRAYILLGEIALHEHRFDQAIELSMQGQVKQKKNKNSKSKEFLFSKFQLMNMIGIDQLLQLLKHYDKIQIKIYTNKKRLN